MRTEQFEHLLILLDLSQTEAAQLLGVSPRTVRRWIEEDEIPGPAARALQAWHYLQLNNLTWRPDSESIAADDEDQIARHREHTIGLAETLERVNSRGGVRLPWTVDVERGKAILGPVEVGFQILASGSFSLSTYTRKDGPPDLDRDWQLVEDAIFCIASRVGIGPVVLAFADRPWKSGVTSLTEQDFDTLNDAIRFACTESDAARIHDAFVRSVDGARIVLDKGDLRAECARRQQARSALFGVADYVKDHSSIFVTKDPEMLSEGQRLLRKQRIEKLGQDIRALGDDASDGELTYRRFETHLSDLHRLGFFPTTELVSDVARSLYGRK